MNKNKVRTVMREFKSGELKSSSGSKVTNPKQAIAIALSEARKSKSMKKGGEMEESEMGMKKGGMTKYAKGGGVASKMGTVKTAAPSRDGIATKGKTKGTMVKMAKGGMTKMKSGGKC